MTKGKCRGCGATILWLKTPAGKNMPCDSQLIPFWIKDKAPGKAVTQAGKVVSCEYSGEREKVSGFGYMPHWATCPAARKFKRKK